MSMPISPAFTDATVESSSSAVSWGPIIAGALAATAISLILMLVGSGLGLTMISPWAGSSSSAVAVGATAAAWLIVVQWLSAALGGYLTGRLHTKWVGIHTYEVFFRDTAHGFLAWTLATLVVVGLLGSVLSAVTGAATQATATVAGAAGSAAANAATGAAAGTSASTTDYFTDTLLRPGDGRAASPNDGNQAAASEISRILISAAAQGEMSADDRAYLDQIVASRTGLSEADAKARVDAVLKRIDDAKVSAQKAADSARKAASLAALLGALSLLVGAFIAGVGAAIGGRQRDEDEERLMMTQP